MNQSKDFLQDIETRCFSFLPYLFLSFPFLSLSHLGQERFNAMSRVYYKEAVGAFVVFDVSQPPTLEMAAKWKKEIDSNVFVGEERENERGFCWSESQDEWRKKETWEE